MAQSQTIHEAVLAIRADSAALRADLAKGQSILQGGLGSMQSMVSRAAGTLGIGLGIGAVAGFGREIFGLADQLQNLHQQTKLSIQLLSGLKSPLEESGTSVDAFARGVFNLQKNLGNVDDENDKVALSIKRLGLNLDDLRNSSPDDFIKKVTDALGKIENPIERNTILFNLLGKSAKELGPAFEQIIGKFDELKNRGLSAEQVKRIDDVGDAFTRMANKIKFEAVDALGSAIEAFEQINRLIGQFSLGRFSGGIGSFLGGIEDKPGSAGLAGLFKDSIIKSDNEDPFKGLSRGKKTQSEAESFLASLQKQTEALKVNIREQVSGADAARNYGLQLAFAAAMAEDLAKGKPIPADLKQKFADFVVQINALGQEFGEAKFEAASFAEAAKRDSQDSAEWLNAAEDVGKVGLAFQKLKEDAEAAWNAMRVGQLADMFSQDSAEWLNANEGVSEELKRQAREAGAVWNNISDGIGNAFDSTLTGILTGTAEFGDQMKNLGRNIALSIANELNRAFIINPMIEGLKNLNLGGLFGGAAGAGGAATQQAAAQTLLTAGTQQGVAAAGLITAAAALTAAAAAMAAGGLGGILEDLPSKATDPGMFIESAELVDTAVDGFGKLNGAMQEGLGSLFAESSTGWGELFSGVGDVVSEGLSSLGSGIASMFSSILKGIGNAFGGSFEQGGLVPSFATGGLIGSLPRFDTGGLAVVHPGEFVLRAPSARSIGYGNLERVNRSGKLPGGEGGGTTVSVQINGDITPRQPNMKKEDIIKVSIANLKDKGALYNAINEYGPRKG